LQFERNMRLNNVSPTGAPVSPSNQILTRQIEALQAVMAQKSTTLSPTHPDIKSLRQQIEALQKQLSDAAVPRPPAAANATDANYVLPVEIQLADQKLASYDSEISLLVEQRAKLEKSTIELRALISKSPQIGSELSDKQRRQLALQNAVTEMTDKLSKARLGERMELDQQAERFEVIEQPTAPQQPVRPNRTLLTALVAGLAGVGGAASALVFELFDGRIRRPKDITNKLKEMPLSVIPYIRTRRERVRRAFKILLFLVILITLVAAGLLFVQIYYRPLDVILFEILSAIGV
jgi:polysaccharide biosynthesis transport protein